MPTPGDVATIDVEASDADTQEEIVVTDDAEASDVVDYQNQTQNQLKQIKFNRADTCRRW